MAENINRSSLWNEAGKAGLILGAVSVVYALATELTAKLSGGPMIAATVSVVNFLLWAIKFAGCIYLMRYFMIKLVKKYSGADNKTTMRFGTAVSLLSALIVAAYSMASIMMMSADEIRKLIEDRIGDNMGIMDLNTRNFLDSFLNNIHIYTFFTMLIYCFIFGYVLSIILSRNIPSRNPFENYKESVDNNQDTDNQ